VVFGYVPVRCFLGKGEMQNRDVSVRALLTEVAEVPVKERERGGR
jgi:hypothetical protein